MKRLFYNIIIVMFFGAAVFFGVILLENFFPAKSPILSPIEKSELSLESKKLSELIEESFDDSLLLINSKYTLSEDYKPALIDLNGKVYVNEASAEAYTKLKSAVKEKFDNDLYIMSAYRSFEEQLEIINSGNQYAAKADSSEHLTGLAFDVYVMYYAGMGFMDSDEGKFVNANCQNYGFIVRYPKGKENITGVTYEPWHLRYVGLPHSLIITENKITLEEYILSMDIGEFYSYDSYIISRQKESEFIEIPEDISEILVSNDNTGCVIITCKK